MALTDYIDSLGGTATGIPCQSVETGAVALTGSSTLLGVGATQTNVNANASNNSNILVQNIHLHLLSPGTATSTTLLCVLLALSTLLAVIYASRR